MLMIGVSTGQNITNVIPAIQKELGVSAFRAIETSTAKSQKWFAGAEKVLTNRGITVNRIDISANDSHIVKIKSKLKSELGNHPDPIIWNLGGGQKPQQIPAWELFYERNKRGIADLVCYTNQVNAKLIEVWYFDKGHRLESRFESIDVDLTASEIFTIFGYTIFGSPKLLYSKTKGTSRSDVNDLFGFQDFRHFAFELAATSKYVKTNQTSYELDHIRMIFDAKTEEIEGLIESHLAKTPAKYFNERNQRLSLSQSLRGFLFGGKKKPGKISELLQTPIEPKSLTLSKALVERLGLHSEHVEVTPDNFEGFCGYRSPGFYFETVVAQRVKSFLETNSNVIVEAFSNLKIAHSTNETTVDGEYDVLCVTNNGTIVALDAKTFEFARKDQDARLYNLQGASGIFMNFSLVLPLDFEDIDTGFVPQELIDLAFSLKKRRVGFYVVSDSTKGTSYWLQRDEKGLKKSKVLPPDSQNWLEMRPLERCF